MSGLDKVAAKVAVRIFIGQDGGYGYVYEKPFAKVKHDFMKLIKRPDTAFQHEVGKYQGVIVYEILYATKLLNSIPSSPYFVLPTAKGVLLIYGQGAEDAVLRELGAVIPTATDASPKAMPYLREITKQGVSSSAREYAYDGKQVIRLLPDNDAPLFSILREATGGVEFTMKDIHTYASPQTGKWLRWCQVFNETEFWFPFLREK